MIIKFNNKQCIRHNSSNELLDESDINSKGVSWDDVFPSIDGVMPTNDFNKMLRDMRDFYNG